MLFKARRGRETLTPRVFTPLRASEWDTYFSRTVPDWDLPRLDLLGCFSEKHLNACLYGRAPSVIDCDFTATPQYVQSFALKLRLLLSLFDHTCYALCWHWSLFSILFLLSRSLIYITSFIFHFMCHSLLPFSPLLSLHLFSFFPCQRIRLEIHEQISIGFD